MNLTGNVKAFKGLDRFNVFNYYIDYNVLNYYIKGVMALIVSPHTTQPSI